MMIMIIFLLSRIVTIATIVAITAMLMLGCTVSSGPAPAPSPTASPTVSPTVPGYRLLPGMPNTLNPGPPKAPGR
jgi:hypothetical protein